MLWAMFCWETLGPAIHVDVNLTRVTYLNIVADQVHPFMAMVIQGKERGKCSITKDSPWVWLVLVETKKGVE